MQEEQIHLWPQTLLHEGDDCFLKATLELPETRKEIWFRLNQEYTPYITDLADPFLPAIIFTAMRYGKSLHIHGRVSPSLLEHLEEFQAAWSSWYPALYRQVEIKVDQEGDSELKPNNGALITFSGGVDSSFSLFRHTRLNPGRRKKEIGAALFIHGFDMALSRQESFHRTVQKIQSITSSLNVPLITMEMNLKTLADNWDHAHGAALAGCLHTLAGGFTSGIIASSYPYIHSHIQIGWGSNPITDHLLSSSRFPIVHDGAEFTRFQKIKAMRHWPELLEHVRVCIRGPHRETNCCRCQKCVRVILYFRLAGVGLPPAFEKDVGIQHILALKLNSFRQLELIQLLLDSCAQEGRNDLWVQALKVMLTRNRLRYWLRNRPLVKKGLAWIRTRRQPL